jgi:ribosomal protein S4
MYFGLDKTGLKPYVNPVKNGLSPLAMLEMRADIVLLRSGMVNSIRHARYLIANGHLTIWSSESDDVYGWQTVTGASQKVRGGTVIRFNPSYYYKTLIKSITDRSSGAHAFNSIPGHLIVDYSTGMIIVVRKPTYDDNFLLPKGSTQYAHSLTTY